MSDAYAIALTMLSRGELSTAQLRDRLRRKGLAHDQIDRALHRLLSESALNDRRAAVSYARHAALIKLRGRFRTTKELEARGIGKTDARAAVTEVFGELDEQVLLERALARRLEGQVKSHSQFRRLYHYLLRQGFDGALAIAELRSRTDPEVLPDD